MNVLDNRTVADYVIENIKTAPIFKKYGIDFCCKGNITINKVCQKNKINLNTLKSELENVESVSDVLQDYNTWSLNFLTLYIENVHHSYVKESLPIISQYINEVIKTYGNTHPELLKINKLFRKASSEVLSHLQKEEQILFPYIKQLIAADKRHKKISIPSFITIHTPIKMLEYEHEEINNLFREIAKLTDNYSIPESVSNTYKDLYIKLEEFEQDLYHHIHLEHNILHRKALELEKKTNYYKKRRSV